MAKRRGPTSKWRPELFEGIPGSPEVASWHVAPQPPLRIVEVGAYRDGGTGTMTVKDARGWSWAFCFDKFLGRLCTGPHPDDNQAAFVRVGSQLEADVFAVMADTLQQLAYGPALISPADRPMLALLPLFYELALAHSGRPIKPGWYEDGGRFVYNQPDEETWLHLHRRLRVGQRLSGKVVWVPRPGAVGVGVDLGLAVGGFVDLLHLPDDVERWPSVGDASVFEIRWLDERPQIRLTPVDPFMLPQEAENARRT